MLKKEEVKIGIAWYTKEQWEKLKKIAAEFSQFSRMPKPQLISCGLSEVLNMVVTLYKTEAITIDQEFGEALPPVRGDKEQLVQVFSNLVKNAIEVLSGVESPKIRIKAVTQGDWVEVIIEDNGPGIVKKQIPHIFGRLLYGSRFHAIRHLEECQILHRHLKHCPLLLLHLLQELL